MRYGVAVVRAQPPRLRCSNPPAAALRRTRRTRPGCAHACTSVPLRRTFYGLLAGYEVREQLHAVDVPTLVLSGRHDWIAPPEESPADFLAGLPEAEGHVFEASGHLPFVEEPEAFLAVVGTWMETHAPASVSL